MRSRWTLSVTDLGPIQRAEVEVRPLMLFVGHNNSGKSYLASLLWFIAARLLDRLREWQVPPAGFPSLFNFIAEREGQVSPSVAYATYKQWLADTIARAGDDRTYELSRQDCQILLAWLNEQFREKRDRIAQRVFGEAAVKIGALEISELSLKAPIRLRQLSGWMSLSQSWHHADTQYSPGDPIYLPASRTGFMLLYKGVVAGLLDQLGNARPPQPTVQLTTPSLHFLQLLAVGLKAQTEGKFAEEASFLERQSFPGKVTLGGGVGVNDVEYLYDSEKPPLPMQLASSLVTELAPIVLVLRHVPDLPVLIIEEPEAHLHPHLQRVLAQTIARLVRKGLYVWITTHSENFCQQINNFIKLGALPEPKRAALQERFGYEAQDFLSMDDVAGYQLKVDPNSGRSSVGRLDLSESGLAMPTFNDELFQLSEQTLALQLDAIDLRVPHAKVQLDAFTGAGRLDLFGPSATASSRPRS